MSHRSGDMHGPPLRRLLVTLLLLVVGHAVGQEDGTTWVDPSTGEVVLLTSGRVQKAVAPLQTPVGLWPHGDRRDDDAAFFAEEDTAYEEWQKKMTRQRKQEQKQQRQLNQSVEDKRDGLEKSRNSLSVELSPLAIKARADARWKLLKELKNSSSLNVSFFENVRKTLEKDAAFLRELLSSDSLLGADIATNGTREEEYIRLINTVFSHTVVNMTRVTKNTWMTGKYAALPYPIVLDGELVTRGIREVRIMEEESRRMEAAWNASNITERLSGEKAITIQLKEDLYAASTILNASRRAHQMVLSLVTPLLPYARQSLTMQLNYVEFKMSTNDESTTALRQELKEYTRRKKYLIFVKERITTAERKITEARYRKTLLQKDIFVLALALIAKLRVGKDTGIGGTDTIPRMGIWTDLTGALSEELNTLVLWTFVRSLAFVAIVSWVLLATREYFLKRGQRVALMRRVASNNKGQKEHVTFHRSCLRLNMLVECLNPFLIPAFLLFRRFFSGKDDVSLYSIFLFSSPTQRLIVILMIGCLVGLSYVVSSVMSTLYRYTLCFKEKERKRS